MKAQSLIRLLIIVLPFAAIGCSNEICAVCLEEKCPDLLELCNSGTDCACMAECVGTDGIPGIDGCLLACGLNERPSAFLPLEDCVSIACPDSVDECATPDNYTPPQTMVCESSSAAGFGGGVSADCGFDTGLPFDPDGSVLQLESADQGVCVRLQRQDEGAGSLANTRWTLIEMAVGPVGEVAYVNSATSLCWFSSHHNFRDWAHVWTGTRHFDLKLAENGHSGDRTYELYSFEQGPLDDPSSCPAQPEGAICIDGAAIELVPFNP